MPNEFDFDLLITFLFVIGFYIPLVLIVTKIFQLIFYVNKDTETKLNFITYSK